MKHVKNSNLKIVLLLILIMPIWWNDFAFSSCPWQTRISSVLKGDSGHMIEVFFQRFLYLHKTEP